MPGSEQQRLVIAVTGHRDLVTGEIDGIRDRVRALFAELREKYPDLSLCLLSPLAEGADQLAAEIALEMGVEVIVPLPMARQDYLQDFTTEAGRDNFELLCGQATSVFELPSVGSPSRDSLYSQLGVFLAAHCHILLAVWDGKYSDKRGGTSAVVRFHHDDVMDGYGSKSMVSRQMLIDDESDLVYHIVCSRAGDGGAPETGFEPLQTSWFTKDPVSPRTQSIPPDHDIIFRRASEFSHDIGRFATDINEEAFSLFSAVPDGHVPDGCLELDRTFKAADWLAVHYQKKTLKTLRVLHVLAFVMGLMFVLFSDIASLPVFLHFFLASFIAAALVQTISKRRAWQRKYLDYRTLAEGLRVQFHWALAGITQSNIHHYSHDNFLQLQDPELGWIRNTMRIAGMFVDAAPMEHPAQLQLVLDEWVGDETSGQLGYYRAKAAGRARQRRLTDGLGNLSLWTSAAVVVIFLVLGDTVADSWVDPLLFLMGVTLLLFGIRHAYAHAIAEKELIKQYEFMLRIFQSARRRLLAANNDDEKRQVLMALGAAALDEHSQWIMMHRERSVDQSEVWRMGSGS